MKIKTILVDDEPLARERIRALLEAEPDIEIIAECSNGLEAVSVLAGGEADLLFLDVQMPEVDGFEVLECLTPEKIPVIIFVTAYDQYALRAFDVHALDYLLKPFDRERFIRALQRARIQIRQSKSEDLSERLRALLAEVRPENKYLQRLVVKSAGRIFFLKAEEIDWIEAAANYVRLHTGRESHLLRETLKGLEARLDPGKFLRLSRSALVNVDRIKELQPWSQSGDYAVILKTGARLNSSRSYRARLEEFLNQA
jgi:two-component system LytT family response regulator